MFNQNNQNPPPNYGQPQQPQYGQQYQTGPLNQQTAQRYGYPQQPQMQGGYPQQPQPQSIFQPMADEQVLDRPDYVGAGLYKIKTRCLKVVYSNPEPGRQPEPMYVHEFEVLETDNPNVAPGTVLCDLKKYHPKAPKAVTQDLKKFFITVCKQLGVDPVEANNVKNWDEAYGGDGTKLAGLELVLQATEKPTKSGSTFTKKKYFATWEAPQIRQPQFGQPQQPQQPSFGGQPTQGQPNQTGNQAPAMPGFLNNQDIPY